MAFAGGPKLSRLSAARGMIGSITAARGGIGSLTAGRGGIGALTAARGGSGLLYAARGGIGVLTADRGGSAVPVLCAAPGFRRCFSSSSWFKRKLGNLKEYEPSDKTIKICTLLGGFTSVTGVVAYGYYWLSTQAENKVKLYVDTKLVEFKTFQNVATGTHHDTVGRFNEAIHQIQREVSELRSKIIELEQKELDHRKELLLATEVFRQQTAAADAGAK